MSLQFAGYSAQGFGKTVEGSNWNVQSYCILSFSPF